MDLFARRARVAKSPPEAKAQLRALVNHAMFREFPQVWKAALSDDELAAAESPNAYPDPDALSADQCYEMLELSCEKIAFLMGEWLTTLVEGG